MKVSDKTLAFAKNLWVQFDGVDAKETGGELKLTARDGEAYLKVFNHFGRLLKLYTFEDGKWMDSETGLAARPFDETQAGHLPEAAPGMTRNKTARKKAPKKPAAPKKAKAVATKAKAAPVATGAKTSVGAKKAEAPAKKAKTPPAAGRKSAGKAKTIKQGGASG